MSNFEDNSEELQEFFQEATELINEAESALLEIDNGQPFKSKYDSIFRVLHSIKGGAGMLGLERLQEHTHSVEDFFCTLKEKESLTAEQVNFLLEGIDRIKNIIAGKDSQSVEITESQPPVVTKELPNIESSDQSIDLKHLYENALIYILDDEPIITDIIAETLIDAGFKTEKFTDGNTLLQTINKTPPQLIISDMVMPDKSGVEVLREIREIDEDLPVIFVSGCLDKNTLMQSIALGVHATIEKPITEEVLLSFCYSGIAKYQTLKLLLSGLQLIMYQFSDFDEYLKKSGKNIERKYLHNEIKQIWEQYAKLKGTGKIKTTKKAA